MTTAPARVPLSTVWALLRDCAPGHEPMLKKHHWWVKYQGKTFHSVSIGEHGAHRPEVFIGKVRSMVRHFGIHECAAKHIPGL